MMKYCKSSYLIVNNYTCFESEELNILNGLVETVSTNTAFELIVCT